MAQAQAAVTFKCPVCNGNVRTGPDDVVITCSYCGSTTTIDGKAVGGHLMETAKESNERVDSFRKFLDKNKGMNKSLVKSAEVVENTLIYVPVWTAKVKADSWYKGYRTVQVPVQKTRTVKDPKTGSTRTETYTDHETGYEPVQNEIHTDTDERLLARKGARFYGLEQYLDTIDLKNSEPYNFEKIKDLQPIMLNAEIGQEEFEKAVNGRVADKHRAQAKSGLTELFDCRTTSGVRETTYLQTPFGFIRYKFQGDLFKCGIDAHSGKVVLGEIPITKGQRAMWAFLGLLGVFLSAIGAEIFWTLKDTEEPIMFVGIVLAIVGVIMAIFGFRTLVMTQREKKG